MTNENELRPMQQAFTGYDALQCGHCTVGRLMSAIACVNQRQAGSPQAIRECTSGNTWQCSAVGIVDAVAQGAETMRL
ncbi:2Fe-2S iron-sulfur cluster-binding protein [Rhizobium leguminosarum]|uniref:2Fe-2S iron-sulfur cluster-binding protein n=1 Tax=Rhizobium leguminosarum TaxID=384 RepID=UPI0039655DB9